jgi:hypothetical protein
VVLNALYGPFFSSSRVIHLDDFKTNRHVNLGPWSLAQACEVIPFPGRMKGRRPSGGMGNDGYSGWFQDFCQMDGLFGVFRCGSDDRRRAAGCGIRGGHL